MQSTFQNIIAYEVCSVFFFHTVLCGCIKSFCETESNTPSIHPLIKENENVERLHYVKAECTSCIRVFGDFPTLLKLPSSEEGGEKRVRKDPNYLPDYGKTLHNSALPTYIQKPSEAKGGFTGAVGTVNS